MTDARLEAMLRDALMEEPSEAADSAVTAAIRREAARRRTRTLVFRWTRRIAAVIAIVALASFPIHQHHSRKAGEDVIGDGEIMLEIIGFASPGDFYAEE
jgi:anti-sigma factor RsiW